LYEHQFGLTRAVLFSSKLNLKVTQEQQTEGLLSHRCKRKAETSDLVPTKDDKRTPKERSNKRTPKERSNKRTPRGKRRSDLK
jgi:hypothetical protein